MTLLIDIPHTSPPDRLSAAAEISQDHHHEMNDEPDVVIAHILVDIDQYQHSRKNDAKQKVSPLRHIVGRIKVGIKKEIDDHHQPRKKERKKQKIEIHF